MKQISKLIQLNHLCVYTAGIIMKSLSQNDSFEVLTVVVMKSSVFWDTSPCSPLKINQPQLATCFMLVSCLPILQL